MKKSLLVFAVLLFFPLSNALAFTWTAPLAPEPGSAGDPIHVLIEPTQSYKNNNLEASLKAQYGSSAYYSCMNRIPSCNGDTSDPRNQTACLQTIQYNFESGRCGASAGPSLTCQQGFTMVNGSCVRDSNSSPYITFPIIPKSPTQQGPTCGEGTVLFDGKCISYTAHCQTAYGSKSYGDGDYCYCEDGYEWTSDMKSCVPSTFNGSITIDETTGLIGGMGGNGGSGGSANVTPDYNQGCKDHYGVHSYWDGTFDEQNTVSCACETGYHFDAATNICMTAPVVEPESQTASLALLTDWNESHPSEQEEVPAPQQERRGFWSWVLSLFGF